MENIIKVDSLDYIPDPRGYGYFLYDYLVKHKNKIAQVDAVTGETDTYSNLLKRCIGIAEYLRKVNVQPGDFISVCTFNHLNACVPSIASYFINAIMGAVDPVLSVEDMVHLLSQTKPKVIFSVPESVATIEEVVKRIKMNTEIIVFGNTTTHTAFSDILASCTEEAEANFSPTLVQSLDDIGIVFFSSGTTGSSKAISHKHYSLICQTINNSQTGFNFNLCFGFYSPYWTVYSLCLGTSIVTGTARLLVPKFDINNPWEPFYCKPNYVILSVFQSLTLCSSPKPEELDTSFIKVIIVTGGTILPEQKEKLQCIFEYSKIYLLYGQSEVFGYLMHFTPKDDKLLSSKTNSVGVGRPGISYKIVDIDSRKTLGANEKGELCVKTKYSMVGYYNMDSSMTWDSDGWLKTGDIGYYDKDYCFYIVHRNKEMFKYQGWHITPSTIEKVLLKHPAVASAIVLGVPHSYDGHRAMGIIVLKQGYLNVSANEIQMFVDNQVEDRLKLREGLKIVDSLPMTPSGKINRYKLQMTFAS